MKYPLAKRFTASIGMAGAFASAMLFGGPLHAQDDSRLSLADRVARLEQQAQNRDQSGINAVNQQQQLQSQMQQLQGQIEELQHQLQELQDKSKAQYVDVDSRLGRLESGAATAGAGNKPTADTGQPAPASSAPVATASASDAGKPAQVTNPPAAAAGKLTPADATAQAAYGVAFKALRGGDYVQASRGFRDFIQKFPVNSLTPNAFYWLGESYYVTKNYQVALEAFQHLLSQFSQSEKAPDALLKAGYSQLELKQTDAAKATLKAVTAKYPGTNVAKLAQQRLSSLPQQSAN
ncbi:MAG: tol-pal system protein YbgF [Rhodanobacter sp.]